MKSNGIKTVREFLKYLQNERVVPTEELHGKQMGYAKREPASLLDMEKFIEEMTDYDCRKLKTLRQDVQWYIDDEEFEAEAINEETKRNSNDEFFLAERAFWKKKYEEMLNKLSDISKLRVRVLLRWIKAKRISDDEFELKEKYPDDIVDTVVAKQTYETLVPGEGTHYPDTSKLNLFLHMIENKGKESTWDRIPDDARNNIDHFVNNSVNKKNRPFAKDFLSELELLRDETSLIEKRKGDININGTIDYLLEHRIDENSPVSKRQITTWVEAYIKDMWDF